MKHICFTGHRNIKNTQKLALCLENTLRKLIQEENASEFYSGGAIGWDTLCAQTVLKLRNEYPHIRLNLILPCNESEQTSLWKESDKKVFKEILYSADTVEFTSAHYYNGCMKKRNIRLIELTECCVCYYNTRNYASGTGQTVRLAEKKNIRIINLYPALHTPKNEFFI
ncbi:MAG: DUF1273 family protein [Oscillospiraceae bacterium]|nr:DUF1273 family protein [Oscillospiraceae bacterium]